MIILEIIKIIYCINIFANLINPKNKLTILVNSHLHKDWKYIFFIFTLIIIFFYFNFILFF